MESKQEEATSANLPLLVDNRRKLHDLKRARSRSEPIIGTASFFKTTFNGLNTLLGVAILSVPYALSSGGWLSLIPLLIIASATCYTGILIERCMAFDPNVRSYSDIGHKAFGPKGRFMVSFFINLELYLIAVGFLILIADNLDNLLPNVEVDVQGLVVSGRETFMLIAAVVILPTIWIDNVTTLSYVSATGVLASVVIACSVFYSGAFDGKGFHRKGEAFNWRGLPTSLSLYAFCYCGHPLFPTLYTSMRNKKQFKWVLVLCFVITTCVCASIAISGYLTFGSELLPQITLNLPTNELSSKVATYTTLFNPLAKFALILKPVINSIERRFVSVNGSRIYCLCTRSIVLGSTVVVALVLPYYDVVISLVGAFTTVIGSILLPCFCYLKISRADPNLGFELGIIVFIVLMGFVILVFGTYASIVQLFKNLQRLGRPSKEKVLAKQEEVSSAKVPLLVDYYKNGCYLYDLERARSGSESITGTASFFKTTFNGLNTLLGVAILSVPYALSSGGWLSLIPLLIIATATCYTGIMIERCMGFDPNIQSYSDIGYKAFGPKGRFVVSLFVNLELYLLVVGFFILIADNLNNLLPNVEVDVQGFIISGRETFLLLAAIIVMPTVWIDDLTTLSYVSATGVVATVIIACSVFYLGAFDGNGFHHKGEVFNWSGLPTSLSLYTFCYCSHPVFPTLYTSMRNRKQFKWVLITCFAITTGVCASIAISGYLMFGSELLPQITLNLPINKLSSKVATYTALVNPLAEFALFLKPLVDAIERRFLSVHRSLIYCLCTRSMLLGSTVIVAIVLPYYDVAISLVGAFTTVIGSILLPCFCYLKISRAYLNLGFELDIIIFIVLMGLVILVFGTYTSLIQLLENL